MISLPGRCALPLLYKAAGLIAFTWGVLDRLLLEANLEIIGITGTSAGDERRHSADGLRRGGRSEARAALAGYWDHVGGLPGYRVSRRCPSRVALLSCLHDHDPIFLWMAMLARIWSPYQANPCNYNPLRTLIKE